MCTWRFLHRYAAVDIFKIANNELIQPSQAFRFWVLGKVVRKAQCRQILRKAQVSLRSDETHEASFSLGCFLYLFMAFDKLIPFLEKAAYERERFL